MSNKVASFLDMLKKVYPDFIEKNSIDEKMVEQICEIVDMLDENQQTKSSYLRILQLRGYFGGEKSSYDYIAEELGVKKESVQKSEGLIIVHLRNSELIDVDFIDLDECVQAVVERDKKRKKKQGLTYSLLFKMAYGLNGCSMSKQDMLVKYHVPSMVFDNLLKKVKKRFVNLIDKKINNKKG